MVNLVNLVIFRLIWSDQIDQNTKNADQIRFLFTYRVKHSLKCVFYLIGVMPKSS